MDFLLSFALLAAAAAEVVTAVPNVVVAFEEVAAE